MCEHHATCIRSTHTLNRACIKESRIRGEHLVRSQNGETITI